MHTAEGIKEQKLILKKWKLEEEYVYSKVLHQVFKAKQKKDKRNDPLRH
jgi:hypothetical protein